MDKIIYRTALMTFFVVFTAFAYGSAFFGLIWPKAMAELCDNIGAYNGSAMYYERIYNGNKTGVNLYNVLNKFIMAENHEKVIKYSRKLLNHEDYDDIIEKANKTGRDAAKNKYEEIDWSNEDNYIKHAYTVSLIKKGKAEKAVMEIDVWLKSRPIDREQPNFAFFALVAMDNVGTEDEIYQTFCAYYDDFAAGYSGTSLHALNFLIFGGQYLDKDVTVYREIFNGL